MYCMKCGKEIREGEQYCGGCGTKAGQTESKRIPQIGNMPQLSIPKYEMGRIDDCNLFFVLSLILSFVCLFLMNSVQWTVSVEVWGYTESVEMGLFENSKFLRIVFYAGYIVAACLLALPVFTDKKWATKNLMAGKVIPVAAIVAVIIARMFLKQKVYNNSEYADILRMVDLEIGMAPTAWFFITANIAMFVSVNILGKKTAVNQWRAEQEQKEQIVEIQKTEEQNVQYERKDYADGSWQCVCGRMNQHYISTCACGRSKFDLGSQQVSQ